MTDENKDFILLGIKYESAKIASVSDSALGNIADQLRREVGEDWESDPVVERGRAAVRAEHGEENGDSNEKYPSKPTKWRFFGWRS